MFHRIKHNQADEKRIAHSDHLPLSDLQAGQTGIVVELSGGKEFLSRMSSLGFSLGAEVTVLQNYHHGPILTCVRASRLALGRGESSRIFVRFREK